MLTSCSFDGIIAVYRVMDNSSDLELIASLEGHENEVKFVDWHLLGDLFASCGRDKTVWIWSVEDNEVDCAAILNGHTQDVKCVKWHPTEQMLFSLVMTIQYEFGSVKMKKIGIATKFYQVTKT